MYLCQENCACANLPRLQRLVRARITKRATLTIEKVDQFLDLYVDKIVAEAEWPISGFSLMSSICKT